MGMQIELNGSTLLANWSKELEQYFNEKRIFVSSPWDAGDLSSRPRICLQKDAVVEEFSRHEFGRVGEAGAFSYCRSPQIDLDFTLGRFCYVGSNVKIFDKGSITGRVTTSPFLSDGNGDGLFGIDFPMLPNTTEAPVIGNDVRIGDDVAIARGVTIGDGAFIQPGSVVVEDVPAYAIVGGNPARILGYRFDSDELRARMLLSKWWEYSPSDLPLGLLDDVPGFVEKIESMKRSGELAPANYAKFDVGRDLLELAESPEIDKLEKTATPVTWQQFMTERVQNKEKGVPWFLHDKLKCYEYLDRHGLKTVTPLRVFSDPATINLDDLPTNFVIKPSLQSSTKGVMVLTRRGEDAYWDEMRDRILSCSDIIEEQEKYFEETKAAGKRVIVEPKILDVESETYSVPRDFKAYAFRGEIALILEIDRNTKPSSVSWYDGDFNPVLDDRVTSNEPFVRGVSKSAPVNKSELVELARQASAVVPTPFASIDMYLTNDGPLVGEITLAPGGLFHGKHYTLSDTQQKLMGEMWRVALMDLQEASNV